jgi:uncharacterized membrane protein YfcA
MVRLIVGVVALLFAADYIRKQAMKLPDTPKPHNPVKGMIWGAASGFTSFVSHAGGPPYQIYTLPLGQNPKILTGTSVIFFSVVNAIKLVPYFSLGQFDGTNLATSAILMPIAPLATIAGAWLVKRMNPSFFFPFMYAMIFVVGIKLVYDGVAGLAS